VTTTSCQADIDGDPLLMWKTHCRFDISVLLLDFGSWCWKKRAVGFLLTCLWLHKT